MIISIIELYIPHTFSNTKTQKPWFNSACFRAIKDREADHKRYSHPSVETHALWISARNHAKSILHLTKHYCITHTSPHTALLNSLKLFV